MNDFDKGSYKNLIVWQKAMDLVDAVFDITEQYPKEHRYGIAAHTEKTTVSIPSNIAEGRRRGGDAEFRRFLSIAYGSGAELETQIEIAKRRLWGKNLDFTKIDKLLDEVMRMLNTLISQISKRTTALPATALPAN
jgi:four helix bundle protein